MARYSMQGDQPEGDKYAPYQQSRSALRRRFGQRAIQSFGPEYNPRNTTGPSGPGAAWQPGGAFYDRTPTGASRAGISDGVPNPPAARAPVYGSRSPTSPELLRPAEEPHLLGPANFPAPGTVSVGTLDALIARERARNKAAYAPGGMGGTSYTQRAQVSAPMFPLGASGRPMTQSRITDVEPARNLTSRYGKGSVRFATDAQEASRLSGQDIRDQYHMGSSGLYAPQHAPIPEPTQPRPPSVSDYLSHAANFVDEYMSSTQAPEAPFSLFTPKTKWEEPLL